MKTTTLLSSSLVLLSLFAFACSGAESSGDDPGSSDDALSVLGTTSHPDAVTACRRAHQTAADRASSTKATIDAENAFRTCLQSANDASVKQIKANLTKNHSSLVSRAEAAVLQFRRTSITLCEELSKADADYGRDIGRIDSVQCSANREALLADVIDQNAFGVAASLREPDRATHAQCYETYDAAARQSRTDDDRGDAKEAFAGCVAQDAEDLTSRVVTAQLANDPSFGPETSATTHVQSAIRQLGSAGRDLCPILAEAGRAGVGAQTRSVAATCSAAVAEDLYTTVVGVVGGAFAGDAGAGAGL